MQQFIITIHELAYSDIVVSVSDLLNKGKQIEVVILVDETSDGGGKMTLAITTDVQTLFDIAYDAGYERGR